MESLPIQLPLFFCLGFCVAILYIDLVFDLSAWSRKKRQAADPLTPVTTYYRYVTRNPWLLIFVMSVALTCIIAEIVLDLVPPWAGYSSLIIFGAIALLATVGPIPGAQRLASGKETGAQQMALARGMLIYHLLFLALILVLALVQISAIRL